MKISSNCQIKLKKKGLDKKNGKFAFVQNLRNYLQHGHIMQGSIHDASGGGGGLGWGV